MTPLFSKVPFVPVRGKVLGDIVTVLKIKDESILYDLGCGEGRVLFAALKNNPNISCLGIEKAPFPYLWAKAKSYLVKNKKVKIIFGDMFGLDVSPATHIFLYLFPELLDALLPKFEKELKPGTRVVSCDFQFSKRAPNETLNLKAGPYQTNHKLFVYIF